MLNFLIISYSVELSMKKSFITSGPGVFFSAWERGGSPPQQQFTLEKQLPYFFGYKTEFYPSKTNPKI